MADLPSRDDILKFVAEQTGKVGKREIARAFRLSGSDRIALKKLLREMAAEGLLEGARKSGMRAGRPAKCLRHPRHGARWGK